MKTILLTLLSFLMLSLCVDTASAQARPVVRKGRPSVATTTLKRPIPKSHGYICSGGMHGDYCYCTGNKDCKALTLSNKCTSDLIDNNGNGEKVCTSNGAGKPADRPKPIRTEPTIPTNALQPMLNKLKSKGGRGPSGYACNYQDDVKACACFGISDCFDLSNSGICKDDLQPVEGQKNAASCNG